MQRAFDFGALDDLTCLRDGLRAALTDLPILPVRKPIDQLIKSLISGLTYDATSRQAHDRLAHAYPSWSAAAAAPPDKVRALIADVIVESKALSPYIGTSLGRSSWVC